MRRGRKLRLAVSVTGATLLFTFTAVPAGFADTTSSTAPTSAPSLVSWTTNADANAIDMVIDDAGGLAGQHPLDEITIPEDTADFETGPFGHGLASVFWPGATGGNFGSASGSLPIPAQLKPLFAQLNDPVRAETFAPSGPTTATYPPGSNQSVFTASSHADANGTTATASLTNLSDALIGLKGVSGTAHATANSTATSTATSDTGQISLLGGLIVLSGVESTATASSDGTTLTGTTNTDIGNLTIAGVPVALGTNGVTGPVGTGGLNGLLTPLVNQVLAVLGLKIVPLPKSETRQAPAETITSGGLQVTFSLPAAVNPTLDLPPALTNLLPASAVTQISTATSLLGLVHGANITITLGRATATAIASAGFGPDLGSPATSATVTPGLGTLGPTDLGTPGEPGTLGTPGTPATSGTPAAAAPSPAVAPKGLTAAILSSPVSVGLMILILLLAALAGYGLWLLARNLEQPDPTGACPLSVPDNP
ncbi:MAG TPA: choice-of-anchor P family protein [Acidimicrobiales bacterium]|nr:choice-of-anchor P family protein [Acidimicrobiales bacterium]